MDARSIAQQLIEKGSTLSLGGGWQPKQGTAIAAAILDLADAVRELAQKK